MSDTEKLAQATKTIGKLQRGLLALADSARMAANDKCGEGDFATAAHLRDVAAALTRAGADCDIAIACGRRIVTAGGEAAPQAGDK